MTEGDGGSRRGALTTVLCDQKECAATAVLRAVGEKHLGETGSKQTFSILPNSQLCTALGSKASCSPSQTMPLAFYLSRDREPPAPSSLRLDECFS